MIKAWQELKRAEIDAQSIQHPSEQYLWCNHNIKINNKVLTDRVWAKSGILKVKDIIGRKGDILRESVKSKVKNKAEVDLKLMKIMKAIPKEWIRTMMQTNSNEETDTNDGEKTLLMTGKHNLLEKVKSKDIYETLLKHNYNKSRQEQKIEEQWGEIKWVEVYKEMHSKENNINRKERDFNWKCIQNAVYTEIKLKTIGWSDGKCGFCEIEEESTEHMLHLCETLDGIWEAVEFQLSKQGIVTKITYRDIMLGRYDSLVNSKKERISINKMISNTKWLIWNRRNELKYEGKWTDISQMIQNVRF